uniref:alpha/beta hydrolase n=1 Tax=uncultured Draconibacterium sp. TaxID=1573823 RepID=UPI00321729BF
MKQIQLIILVIVLFISTPLLGQVANEPICIGEKIVLKSDILNQDREIYIYLPKDYDTSDLKYSTHYVLDGEIIFFSYSGIVEIKSQNEDIPEAIVIGIPNINRGFDLNSNANGHNFLKFVTQELIPYIDNNYRTNENRVLTGYSMAGNFVIYALLSGQDYFNMFLSGSPYRLDMYTDETIGSFFDSLKSKKTLYTSIGSKDRAKQLEIYNTFCMQFSKESNRFLDFKHEVVMNRDHDNNFLINWQDGLDYIYKDWDKEKKE